MKIKERTGCTVIGYKKQDGTYIINPDIQTPVDTEGRIIVTSNFDQINKLNSVFQIFCVDIIFITDVTSFFVSEN